MSRPSCGPGAAFPISPYIALGVTAKVSCCVLSSTEVIVVTLQVSLAPRLPLVIAPASRPAALRELNSTTTRQPTTCKCSPGLGRCLKERNIVSVMLFDCLGGGGIGGDVCSVIYWLIMTGSCRAMTCLKPVLRFKKKKLLRLHVQIGIFLNISVYIHGYMCNSSVLMFALSLSSRCVSHTYDNNAHKPACTTPLNTTPPPPPFPTSSSQSNFVRS